MTLKGGHKIQLTVRLFQCYSSPNKLFPILGFLRNKTENVCPTFNTRFYNWVTDKTMQRMFIKVYYILAVLPTDKF